MSYVKDFFEITRGMSGITEEFIYNNPGDIPVISASSDKFTIFGCVNEEAIPKNKIINYPAVLIIRVGKAGFTQIVSYEKYIVTENVLVLIPKRKYVDSFNMKWVENQLRPELIKNARGEINGQRNISTTIIKKLKFNNIDLSEQEKYSKLILSLESIDSELKNSLDFLQNANIDYLFEEYDKIKIKDCFNILGGTSGLTEEIIYQNYTEQPNEEIPIFSGATLKNNFMGFIAKNNQSNINLKIFKGPAILVARKGNAGTMKYIPNYEFTINDDAYVMILKEEWIEKINLKWFINQYQELFFNLVTSKSDNGTFNKSYVERQIIRIPDINFQNNVAKKIQIKEEIIESMQKLENEVEYLLNSQII